MLISDHVFKAQNSFTTKNRGSFSCHQPKDIINVQVKGGRY